jgi:transcriptional regulator with XRE-family HTH domain
LEAGDFKSRQLGRRLKSVLQSYQKTPAWLAEQTDIGVRTIYSILNGHHTPSPGKLSRICQALRISMDDLFDIEVNSFPMFPEPYQESLTYAEFERHWLGERGGERISVSRGFSIMNQSDELRRNILEYVYKQTPEQTELTMQGFRERRRVIAEREKARLEIVVESEVVDFIHQRGPYDGVAAHLIYDCIEGVIRRLEEEPQRLEVVLIPRQFFLVNYEIINREVILFDLGTVYLSQTHPRMVDHFLKEVTELKTQRATYRDRNEVVEFLRRHLQLARAHRA